MLRSEHAHMHAHKPRTVHVVFSFFCRILILYIKAARHAGDNRLRIFRLNIPGNLSCLLVSRGLAIFALCNDALVRFLVNEASAYTASQYAAHYAGIDRYKLAPAIGFTCVFSDPMKMQILLSREAPRPVTHRPKPPFLPRPWHSSHPTRSLIRPRARSRTISTISSMRRFVLFSCINLRHV